MKCWLLIPLVVALSACGTVDPPAQNRGFHGWWPAGFGYPPLTVRAPDGACTVSAYGPTLPRNPRAPARGRDQSISWTQNYGGETHCAIPALRKSLLINEQVRARNGTWFTIRGSSVIVRSDRDGPLRAARSGRAYVGHVYRVLAHAVLVVADRRHRCSAGRPCRRTVRVTATGRELRAQYP